MAISGDSTRPIWIEQTGHVDGDSQVWDQAREQDNLERNREEIHTMLQNVP